MRVERDNPVGVRIDGERAGKPTAREAQSPGGQRMTKKRMPVAERRQEAGTDGRTLRRSSRITGRIRARSRTRKGADVVRWACEETMTDDTRTEGHVGRHGLAVVNGPEGDALDWLSIDWAARRGTT